ncbi:MAG: ABC transporter substrate-binding protein, partial [Gammaproteobacteria bacterium]|nr:ABC transporter substrate-binding protein [Gammaproteobacteria bacterium]
MKFVSNILKAFLINLCFIGIIFASETCPAVSPKIAGDRPTAQVHAILNDIVCSFIELQTTNNGTLASTLNLTKKKILPYIDLEYFTEMALGDYWNQLDSRQKKIFERDIKNSLIDEYIVILASFNDWEDIQISVNEDFSQIENMAKVKVAVSLEDEVGNTTVTLKLIKSNRWKIYDLDYQTISIVGIEKIGYDSKIKRQGIEKLIQK